MRAPSVALILGFGPESEPLNSKTAGGFLSLKADFTKPDSIPPLFAAVRDEFHASPSVVVYNAAVRTPPPVKESVFSTPAETIVSNLSVNIISPYVAARQAISGWALLPNETKKTLIYVGNILNVCVVPSPIIMTLGMGKSASAYWIGLADDLYSTLGFQ
ncbi:uncharacterized protein Z519_06598 [Cladophialophora bantiana CBS 173.52]|uniref:Uncharacterized protein n=1 Tax=Cladophialophora bantiana (strain ATCC 10958 / CBS 173.52 / CDC B-1940 / NIH 8579) TaxID=1442370 RepID=A0A0D2HPH4_CLAB1|nr:uncharacterized protein Z519_06598 [Cladophialophora bantiana CBS 173.52]KIW92750.1 hypothetical protein Z519_06598 [Cladophialophora bantiana CBS 173.52]